MLGFGCHAPPALRLSLSLNCCSIVSPSATDAKHLVQEPDTLPAVNREVASWRRAVRSPAPPRHFALGKPSVDCQANEAKPGSAKATPAKAQQPGRRTVCISHLSATQDLCTMHSSSTVRGPVWILLGTHEHHIDGRLPHVAYRCG